MTSPNLHSTYPPKTRCNTFYFISPIKEEIQQKYINYCQYVIGKNLGYENGGCVICSDCSGKIIPPGYSLYFPFSCQNEQCYDKSNSDLIDDLNKYEGKDELKEEIFNLKEQAKILCDAAIDKDQYKGIIGNY